MKIKTFEDYETGEQLDRHLNLFIYEHDVKDIKFSSAVGTFDGSPFHTVSAMVIYED